MTLLPLHQVLAMEEPSHLSRTLDTISPTELHWSLWGFADCGTESAHPLFQAIRQKKLEQLKADGIPAKYLAELARVRFTADKLH